MPRELPDPPSPGVLNAIAHQAFSEYGYLLPPSGTEVYRRSSAHDVVRVPLWEATAVHHLITSHILTRGGPVFVHNDGTRCRMYVVERRRW